MTEEEAKGKTCCGPLPVLIGLVITAVPGSKDIPKASCIGSACMAWRWDRGVDKRAYTGTAAHMRPGFCGLAGGDHA